MNLDAVERFARHRACGSAISVYHTPQQSATLDVCLVSLGYTSQRTPVAFRENLCIFSVCDLFVLRDHVEDVVFPTGDGHVFPLQVTALVARLSGWDPDVLEQFWERYAGVCDGCRGRRISP